MNCARVSVPPDSAVVAGDNDDVMNCARVSVPPDSTAVTGDDDDVACFSAS